MKSLSVEKKMDMSYKSDIRTTEEENIEYLYPGVKIAIIMPAYNEERNIGATLALFPKNISDRLDIIVIDDGSCDRTCQIARAFDTIVIKHKRNRGNGAAIQTGLDFCREHNYEIAVIIDADGQHDPKHIEKFINPIIEEDVDFVVGNRFKHYYNMSALKKLCSRMMSIFYTILLQRKVSDPTMGYRALSSKVFKNIKFESEYSITQEMLFKVVPRYNFHEISTRIYEREYGELFIKLNKYLKKLLFSIIKFYLFPKFKKIVNLFLKDKEIETGISKLIKT